MSFEFSELRVLNLKNVIKDATFQVRNKLDVATIDKYASAIESGCPFPPLKVAEIDGKLYLLDGFHRARAYAKVGRGNRVEAYVVRMKRRDALKEAALSNLTHGLPLKSKEKRNVFQQYIRGNGHKKPDGEFKSYREIEKELQGIARHTTLNNWMRKDFPAVFRQMGGGEGGDINAGPVRIDHQDVLWRQLEDHIINAQAIFEALSSTRILDANALLRVFADRAQKKAQQVPVVEF